MAAAATQFGIVYGTDSGIIRRIIFPDDDAWFVEVQKNLQPGEALSTHRLADHPPGQRTAAALQAVVGPAAHSGNCVTVEPDTGEVVAVIVADPAVTPTLQGREVIASDEASIGWVWDGNQLVDPRPIDTTPPPVKVILE